MTMRRYSPEARRDIAIRLRAEGKSLREIGRYLGVSRMTVKRDLEAFWTVTLGVTFDPPDVTADVTAASTR